MEDTENTNTISINNRTKKKSKKDYREKYFINDVEKITGIKAFTLRIWEQRYKIISPKRTETNIRYYDDKDIKYLINVSMLNANGVKIGKIAILSHQEVQDKVLLFSQKNATHQHQINALSIAMFDFNEIEFNKILSMCIFNLGMEKTTIEIIFPYMQHLGILWLGGSIHVAHEHFVTNIIKQRLYVSIDQLAAFQKPAAKHYLLFLPSGETHDLSLLFAAFILKSRGQKATFLGSSTPLDDLNKVHKMVSPDVLFCSISNANNNFPLEVYINMLSRNFPNSQILITGGQVVKRRDLTLAANCVIIENPEAFFRFVDENQTH
ncbi:MAG: MerR family transcriptional regulator [Flavobacteriaceae bacterium]|nr:MerR family transcriptional regulator [Flavobacteriaceae bacterium]